MGIAQHLESNDAIAELEELKKITNTIESIESKVKKVQNGIKFGARFRADLSSIMELLAEINQYATKNFQDIQNQLDGIDEKMGTIDEKVSQAFADAKKRGSASF